MATQSQPPNSERTPLLRDAPNGRTDENRLDSATENLNINSEVKTLRHRRWISLVVSALLIVAFILILIFSGIFSHVGQAPDKTPSLCLSPACIHASSEILRNLSPEYKKIDPCTDFDTLVCDGFINRHDIPQDKSSYSTATIMLENGQTTLRHILESPYPTISKHSSFSPQNLIEIAASTDEENFRMVQDAYNSCLDEATLQEIGVEPLVRLINQVAASFPVDGASGSDASLGEADYAALSNTILLLERIGVPSFIGITAGADDKNPDVVIIQGYPAGLTLPSPEYYHDKDTVSTYETMLGEVFASLLPTNSSRSSAKQLAQSVIDFEKKIAAATPSPEDQSDVTKYYTIVNIDDVGKIAPAIGLDSIVKSLAPHNYTTNSMLLAFPEFLGKVSDILSKTSKSTVQSYLIWQLINQYSSYVEGPEVQPILRFSNTLFGRNPDTKTERWKTCVSYVDSTVGWILSRFYIEATFSDEAKQFGDQIILDIKKQFISKLNDLSWMDDSVKKLAVNKVNNIDQKIGFPTTSPNITNPKMLQAYYNGLNISTSFFNNTLSSNTLEINRTWSTLGKPVDHGEWGMQADIVNAYYNPVGNEIVFPAGIMQFPVFQLELPSYVSYGAFASVAGHELSHAFDNSGRHYDEHGNFTDWWTDHTVREFETRADCFVEQYANFTVEGSNGESLHVNGRLTLGENIADAGGVSAAFAAWKSRTEESSDQDLPGLDFFTHDQLFFVFYANWWCGMNRREEALRRIYTDPHSPAFARILGTTANSKAFRESFKCPIKEPMCELW
ncbi:endothelin-converting enzyme 1 [Daldinia caldariorum]|uniref:endothelin-converting enzyme 1 n=1 Tax=Daldinia caldariorum TaxID=326644 RepID=UPI0020089FCD|nr:endothelin-converting enzyme 1 [Daldinia caldariorum]KAI1471624.1 endothelin-converting enzyme 1 [Daldinia caldariorum]